jgi:Mn-dependent DtxR family transcriptional regulator
MRKSADWMVLADDRILEFLRESDKPQTATKLDESEKFHTGRSNLSKRLNKLSEAGLVTPLGNGVYTITDEGEAYLDERYHVEKGVYLDADQADESDGPTAGEGVGEL